MDTKKSRYIPRSRNIIQRILKDHFSAFEESYEEKFAKTYGSFRIIRIKAAVTTFLDCGDYHKGIARIKCISSDCSHKYFRPFSCKTWYLCPSCHQKRILLFSEHLDRDVLLKLPHRQFVFAIPKALRVFFRFDHGLFADISRMIFTLIREYFNEAAGKPLTTGAVVIHAPLNLSMLILPFEEVELSGETTLVFYVDTNNLLTVYDNNTPAIKSDDQLLLVKDYYTHFGVRTE